MHQPFGHMDRALPPETNFYDQGLLTAGSFFECSTSIGIQECSGKICYFSTVSSGSSRVTFFLSAISDHEFLPEILNLISSQVGDLFGAIPSPPVSSKSVVFDSNSTWIKREYKLNELRATLWIGVRIQEEVGHA